MINKLSINCPFTKGHRLIITGILLQLGVSLQIILQYREDIEMMVLCIGAGTLAKP